VSGNNLSKSPAWAGAFGVQYEFDVGRWGFFTPRFQTQFQDTTYYRVFNTDFDSQEPFIKYDAKIMWRSEDDRFTAEVFGVNLSDEDVLNSVVIGSQLTGGAGFGQYQAPRTYGVRLGINYVSDWLAEML
jgi:iron complex outermembrane receptor protein